MRFPPLFASVVIGATSLAMAALLLVAPTSAAEVRLVAFGDSLVHGYGLAAGETFPEQLQAALAARGQTVRVINAGNSGDTSASGRARLEWALADGADAVLVELGANDGLRGLDPDVTFDNLDSVLRRLRERGLPVLLAGMLAPRNLGREYATAFDGVFPRLAKRHKVEFYPFFLEGVAMQPRYNQADGIHPNAAGVAVIVEGILPAVQRLLASVGHNGNTD